MFWAIPLRYPTAEETAAHVFSPEEQAPLHFHKTQLLTGTSAQVRDQLVRLAAPYEVDELSLVSTTTDFAGHLRSYKTVGL